MLAAPPAEPAPPLAAPDFGVRGTADGVRPYALTTGHIDLFEVTYDAALGGLRLSTKDDTGLYAAGAQYRDPTGVTVYVDSEVARFDVSTLPAAYGFLAADGPTIYMLPQTQSQKPTLPWPGWSTERLPGTLPAETTLPATGTPVSLELQIDGPGEVFTWQTGSFGQVQNRYVDTTDPAPDVIPISRSAHVHTNWAFTRPGDYALTVTPRATPATGLALTGPSVVYLIHVGPAADAAPRPTTAPALAGTGAVGETLTADTGAWLPTPHATTVAWLRDGAPIEGAGGVAYPVSPEDEGHRIAARVTASVGGQATSAETAEIRIGDPGEQPGEPDTQPVPDEQLTEASRGGVVLSGGPSFEPGQAFTVQLGERYAGEWVSPWIHSSPSWLGWARASDTGAATLRVPAGTAAGAHRLVIKDRDGALIGWTPLPVQPAAPPPVVDPPASALTTPRSQCVGGTTILSAGHIDYATRIVNGKLESYIGDDTSGSKVFREPSGVVLWLKPASAVTLPGGIPQIGPAGSRVWQVPQTQAAELIWLGWSTEALNAGNASGAVSWSLDSVSGPGTVKVYTTGSFGGVTMVLNGPGTTSVPLGVHAHANWAFSAEGIYRLRFTQTATLANGQRSSDTETVTIAVGDVDPASASGGTGCGSVSAAALQGGGAATADGAELVIEPADEVASSSRGASSAPEKEAATGDPISALRDGDPVPLLVAVLAALLLVGAGGAAALWFRRRRTASP
ncbi:MAG: TIGR03773 family transporter-associated surface protein [Protaetiibacter sp.]